MSTSLHATALTVPMNVDDAKFMFFIRDLLIGSYQDHPPGIQNELIANAWNRGSVGPFKSALDVDTARSMLLTIGSFGTRCTSGIQLSMSLDSAYYGAVPVINRCLKCKGDLVARRQPGTAPVFYDLGVHGKPGQCYMKDCKPCGITFELDGYQLTADQGSRHGVKYMYIDARMNHPK